MHSNPEERTIRVAALARVEGAGSLHLTLRDGQVVDARLEIFEPPRFFEAFLRGRDYREAPDITARICGICPVAYQLCACGALEDALGVADQIEPGIRALRELFLCGEWIESHALHLFLLHLPDFLGYESALSMAAEHGDLLRRGLRIRAAGNAIITTLGERAIHPVNACPGGFHHVPAAAEWDSLRPALESALEEMSELTLFLARELRYPALTREYEFVALCPPDAYPLREGPIVSSGGLNVDAAAFADAIEEEQQPESTALYAHLRGRGSYLTGPLARLNLNAERLHPRAAALLPPVCSAVGALPWRNPFLSLPARALEIAHALARALDILADYPVPAAAHLPIAVHAGDGSAAIEAPRGLLWHRYSLDAAGLVTRARIIPPTSQNQAQIDADLRALAAPLAALPDEALSLRCEQLIRSYDPCISCATHFLKLAVERQ